MSHPPEYPGRQRLKRLSARNGTDAYQGAFEAVGAVLVACGFGFWFDRSWETSPWGLVVGVVIGFAAMVLRLVRLGDELHPDAEAANPANSGMDANKQSRYEEDEGDSDSLGVGVSPGMSDALSDYPEGDDSVDRNE